MIPLINFMGPAIDPNTFEHIVGIGVGLVFAAALLLAFWLGGKCCK